MNLLDVVIISCMVFLIVRGVFRGFIREVGSLAGVILGIWLAALYQPQATHLLDPFLPSGKFLPLIAFALVFFVVLVLCNVVSRLLKKLIKKVFLGWADRALGAFLAVLKGVVITYFAIVLLTFFVPAKSNLIAESKLAPTIIDSYQSIVGLLSPEAYENLKKKFMGKKEQIKKAISEKIESSAGKNGHQ